MQHLDGGLLLEPQVLTQVHLGVAAPTQQAHQPVVAEVLSGAICHLRLLNTWLLAGTRPKVERFSEESQVYCRGNTPTRQANIHLTHEDVS